MNIQFVGAHNRESLNSRHVSILIDNVLAVDAGGLTSGLTFPAQQDLKAVLLTHHHYDHIRDIPALAMNFFLQDDLINIYSTKQVYNVMSAFLLNDTLYPNFLKKPPGNPTVRFTEVEPYKAFFIEEYNVLPIPVKHSDYAVGYQITSADGIAVFFTGDTGPDLSNCWERVSPDLLIIDVTAPSRFEEQSKEKGHLTPSLLRQELLSFQNIKGYLPQVITVHMNPDMEREIEAEIAEIACTLSCKISLAQEGMLVQL